MEKHYINQRLGAGCAVSCTPGWVWCMAGWDSSINFLDCSGLLNFDFMNYIIQIEDGLAGQVDEVFKSTGLNPSSLIEMALIDFFDKKAEFVNCPLCHTILGVKGCINIESPDPVTKLTCFECGTVVQYDQIEDKILYQQLPDLKDLQD